MSQPTRKVPRRAGLSSDLTLGIVGGCLAAASATFGIAMTVHGPIASLGTSGNFTVFAQLAPRSDAPRAAAPEGLGRPSFAADDLDRTATASIPARRGSDPASGRIATVTLEKVDADAATILVDGKAQVVRVGDAIPGAGEVLSILGGSRPVLRTSRGLIARAGR